MDFEPYLAAWRVFGMKVIIFLLKLSHPLYPVGPRPNALAIFPRQSKSGFVFNGTAAGRLGWSRDIAGGGTAPEAANTSCHTIRASTGGYGPGRS